MTPRLSARSATDLLAKAHATRRGRLFAGNGAALAAVSAMLVSEGGEAWTPALLASGWCFFVGLGCAAAVAFAEMRALQLAQNQAASPGKWSTVSNAGEAVATAAFFVGVSVPLISVTLYG